MDECLIYRAGDLIVDDDLTLNSLSVGSLLVGGANVRPMAITKFTTVNINNALSNPISFDATGDFNNMASKIFKQSVTAYEVLEAGQYYINLVLNCTASASGSQIQILKGVSVVATGNISSADSGVNLAFPITLAVADTISLNAVRIGTGNAAKNLFLTSSSLFITKL